MNLAERTLQHIYDLENRRDDLSLSPAAEGLLILILILTVVSLPVSRPEQILPFAFYPMIRLFQTRLQPLILFRDLAMLSPFILLIALPNLFLDRTAVLSLGTLQLTEGFLSFHSILSKSFITVSSLLVFVRSRGILSVLQNWESLPLPRVFTQLVSLMYRYLVLLLRESIRISQARRLRGGASERHPVREAAQIIGQLFLRSLDRAGRIQQAMELRQYSLAPRQANTFKKSDALPLLLWLSFFILFRIAPVSEWLGHSVKGWVL